MDTVVEESDGGRCDSPLQPCLSFDSYASGGLADVAGRVCREEELASNPELASSGFREQPDDEDEDDDFEFVSLFKNSDQLVIGGPVYPVFNRDVICGPREGEERCSIKIPLKSLFLEDRDPLSCSSSEADELDGVPEGSYCVWNPRLAAEELQPSPPRCKKSNSTGSCSKRWRFRDLLRRSNSDGKDSSVFLTPTTSIFASKEPRHEAPPPKEKRALNSEAKYPAKGKPPAKDRVSASAHGAFYARNRAAVKENDRRRSYLPYRRDLVGFFAAVNGLSRSFPSL
ncbi:hypothetical protein SAY86_013532 [Trapa natans]|uniref:Uncharacterized protein n=1 Tax=Trapa natans TaxID=22666 RepID=A0AAN7KZC5_TRANT|nr:hypothetical protein SAY86_013532 [Trapa natans]